MLDSNLKLTYILIVVVKQFAPRWRSAALLRGCAGAFSNKAELLPTRRLRINTAVVAPPDRSDRIGLYTGGRSMLGVPSIIINSSTEVRIFTGRVLGACIYIAINI